MHVLKGFLATTGFSFEEAVSYRENLMAYGY